MAFFPESYIRIPTIPLDSSHFAYSPPTFTYISGFPWTIAHHSAHFFGPSQKYSILYTSQVAPNPFLAYFLLLYSTTSSKMDYQRLMDYQMHQSWMAIQSHPYQSQFQYDHGNVSLAFDGLDSGVCRSSIRSTIQALDNQINTMIRQWNQFCPKAPNYYDLHGMTSRGAVEYVLDIVQLMRVNGVRTSWLETGKGKHSLDNIPAIKTILLRDYHGVNGCYFVPLSSNDGVLELTVI
ncbi:hypothetical protein B9Z55_012565 [Caenorhabditis nigoni]|uniref:Smr domain-containing protein n=1 Tax=Caenorhabditis nigoni TaxID=1611254 RepID=A0A2G5TYC5_9PELO|nr:hypothetical protein B9Z55_012565 [Caenorhabditis nigoni]